MPDAQLLTRGKIEGAAIGAGATTYFPGPSSSNIIHCEGDSELTINADMTAGAAGDLAITVEPIAADGVTPMVGALLPATNAPTTNPSLSGGHAYFTATFDVSGFDAVRVGIKNNNAGGQTITRASWRLT
jgi:hypothetical protein